MPLSLDARARRLLRRLPHDSAYTAIEIALLLLLALQGARLIWAVATPLGPLGEWRGDGARVMSSPAIFAAFDPFFRLSQAGAPIAVTGLSLTLHGVREDRASGRGSAILGLPDGSQGSFAVGEEIMPGVKLVAVAFDNITIDRGGAREQLFLDQSQPADTVAPEADATASAQPEAAPTGDRPILNQIQFQPRRDANGITGFVLQPRGDGAAFRAAGLQPGDVLIAVNGRAAGTIERPEDMAREFEMAGEASVQIERGGRQIMLSVRAPR
jgi:general secretion pathway protein C